MEHLLDACHCLANGSSWSSTNKPAICSRADFAIGRRRAVRFWCPASYSGSESVTMKTTANCCVERVQPDHLASYKREVADFQTLSLHRALHSPTQLSQPECIRLPLPPPLLRQIVNQNLQPFKIHRTQSNLPNHISVNRVHHLNARLTSARVKRWIQDGAARLNTVTDGIDD